MGATVRVRGEGGWEFDQDIPAEGTLAREAFDDSIRRGVIRIVGDDPRDVGDAEPAGDVERPAKSANKASWVAFAVSQGVEQDVAENYSKDDLIALYAEPAGDVEP
jgi:hypothetical protein